MCNTHNPFPLYILLLVSLIIGTVIPASFNIIDLFHLSLPDPADPIVTISGPTTGTAGENVQLTCSVSVVEYLTVQPTVQWSGGSVDRGNGVTESNTTHSGVMSMKTVLY